MGRSCAACNEGEADGIYFHGFPKDEVMKSKWVAMLKLGKVRTLDWKPKRSSRLCSRHFTDSCYHHQNKSLNSDAVPSIFLWKKKNARWKPPDKNNPNTDNAQSDENMKPPDTNNKQPNTNNNLPNAGIMLPPNVEIETTADEEEPEEAEILELPDEEQDYKILKKRKKEQKMEKCKETISSKDKVLRREKKKGSALQKEVTKLKAMIRNFKENCFCESWWRLKEAEEQEKHRCEMIDIDVTENNEFEVAKFPPVNGEQSNSEITADQPFGLDLTNLTNMGYDKSVEQPHYSSEVETNDDVRTVEISNTEKESFAECASCQLLFLKSVIAEHMQLCPGAVCMPTDEGSSVEKEVEQGTTAKKNRTTINVQGLLAALSMEQAIYEEEESPYRMTLTTNLDGDGRVALTDLTASNANGTPAKKLKLCSKCFLPWHGDTCQGLFSSKLKAKRNAPRSFRSLQQRKIFREMGTHDDKDADPWVHKHQCKRIGKTFICKLCNAPCKNKHAFFSHVKNDCPHKHFVCKICNIDYRNVGKLNLHYQSHANVKKFLCETCNMGFISNGALKLHRRIHSDEKPFKCSECGTCFRRKDYLQFHEKTKHHKKPPASNVVKKFACNICSKRFFCEKWYKLHLQKHNGGFGECKYLCENCGKEFKTEMGLKRHLTIKCCEGKYHKIHKVVNPEHEERRRKIAREKTKAWFEAHKDDPPKFQCGICFKKFKYSALLKCHYDTHATEKRYECNLCSKRFKIKNSLRRHLVAHGEGKLGCEYCERRFDSPSALQLHQRSHSQDRPFVCRCGKLFKYRGDLMSHFRKHKAEEIAGGDAERKLHNFSPPIAVRQNRKKVATAPAPSNPILNNFARQLEASEKYTPPAQIRPAHSNDVGLHNPILSNFSQQYDLLNKYTPPAIIRQPRKPDFTSVSSSSSSSQPPPNMSNFPHNINYFDHQFLNRAPTPQFKATDQYQREWFY